MSGSRTRMGWLSLLLAIGGCVGGQGARDTSPTTVPVPSLTSDESSGVSSPIVRPLRDQGGTAILDPGTYVLDQFPVDLAFDIPDGDPPGWHVGFSRSDVATVLWYTPPEITFAFAFWTGENLYVDACDPAAGELAPPIGPSVDDLVAALSNQPGFGATDPVDVTVGAFRGKEIELTALRLAEDCPAVVPWTGADDTAGLASGETLRAQILDVDGVRIVTHARAPVQPDAAVEAELQQILDSIRVESLP
jgi:hypothetical protein